MDIISVFYSYAHEDERLRRKLETHLGLLQQKGLIASWHDRNISAGTEWAHEINTHLNTAQIILLLVSASFLASKYCYSREMTRALERHEAGSARVIPIILRPVSWEHAPFSKLQALPTGARPITGRGWHNSDEAFADVAQGIGKVVEELRSSATGRYQISKSPPFSEHTEPTFASLDASSRPLGGAHIGEPGTEPPKDFSVTTLKDGQVVRAGEIKGTYSSKGSGRVWVVLEDDLGQYSLQTPPVQFLDNGEWTARNIIPGAGI